MKQLWKIIGIVAAIGIVFTGAGLALGANTAGMSWGSGGFRIASRTMQYVHRTHMETFNNIYVNVSHQNVRVVQANYFGFEARYRDHTNFQYSFENGTLTITTGGFNIGQVNFMGFGNWESERITIFLPANASLDDVNIELSSGRVNIDQLNASTLTTRVNSGNVTINNLTTESAYIRTTSGNVRLTDTAVEGSLDLRANSGNVTVTNVAANSFELRTTSGNIRASSIVANGLMADANSGNITIEGTLNGYTRANATSGRVRINATGSESDFIVSTSVGSGRVRINGRNQTSLINTNAPNRIDAQTRSGNININFTR